MNKKNILGAAILIILFLGGFALLAMRYGLMVMIQATSFACGITALICIGIWLLNE